MSSGCGLLAERFRVRGFEHSLNAHDPDSKLRVQVQLDPALDSFIGRAERRDVMDLLLPVAAPEDLVDAKVAAASGLARRPSKRLKDTLDLARLVMAFPETAERIPEPLRSRVMEAVDPVEPPD